MVKRVKNILIFTVLLSVLVASVTLNLFLILQTPTLMGIVDHKSIGQGTDGAGEPVTWYTVSLWLVTEDKVNGLDIGETLAYIVEKDGFDRVEAGDVVKAIPLQNLRMDILDVIRRSPMRLNWQRTGGFLGLEEELVIYTDRTVSYKSDRFGDGELVLTEAEFKHLHSLLDEAKFLPLNESYPARPDAADYYTYQLTVNTPWVSKTVEWVDDWASEKTIPSALREVQLYIETIIQRIHQKTGASQKADERAVEIAKHFIVQAPTFRFDGIQETLKVTDVKILESFPVQYVITITFDSRHAGYGDRTGQVLAQVITPHTAIVKVVNDKVVSAILDDQWDELKQEFIPIEQQQGIISGKVSIGPLCPVEPCPDQPDIYLSREIILQPEVGNSIHIKLNSDGSFQAKVNAGTYTVNLTNCIFLGCENTLPKIVTVEPNKVTWVDIIIDTGIR